MQCIETNNLQQLLEQVKPYTKKGKLATYIPELGNANPDDLGIAIFIKKQNTSMLATHKHYSLFKVFQK